MAAEFERPVMLYSIGKDSSVMLRLAQKAFHPGPIPFPLLHINTAYKFREMIAFREKSAPSRRGAASSGTISQAVDAGTNPFASAPNAAAAC